jgi:hypothetical protein
VRGEYALKRKALNGPLPSRITAGIAAFHGDPPEWERILGIHVAVVIIIMKIQR